MRESSPGGLGAATLPAARAHLLRRLGRVAEAADAYRQALDLISDRPERAFLHRRLRQVSSRGRGKTFGGRRSTPWRA
jgi:RNA polymerase sigma-70 factor (ECF subfamily)